MKKDSEKKLSTTASTGAPVVESIAGDRTPTIEQLEEARFRQDLHRRRVEKDWSMGEVARKMVELGWDDFHQATISRIEKGQRPVRLGEARALARIFETHVGNMIHPSPEMRKVERLYAEAEELRDNLRKVIRYAYNFEESKAQVRSTLKTLDEMDLKAVVPEDQLTMVEGAIGEARKILNMTLNSINDNLYDTSDDYEDE